MKKTFITLLAVATLATAPLYLTSCNNENKEETHTEGPELGKQEDHTTDAPETGTANANTLSGPVVTVDAIGNNMDEMRYSATTIRMPANTDVTIHLVNKSTDAAMPHNLVIVKKGTEKDVAMAGLKSGKAKDYLPEDKSMYIAATEVADPEASTYVKFKSPAAGEYAFVCTYPGHWEKMQGSIIFE